MPSSEKSDKAPQGKKIDKESKQPSAVDPLKQAYFSVEDKYYELMDFFEDKVRVPVYEYFVEPIEKNGIPSFPIGILLVLLLGLGIFMVATGGAAQTGDVTISLLSASGQAVNGATVTLYVGDSEEGEQLDTVTSSNGRAVFSGVPLGQPLFVTVSAANYKDYSNALGTVASGTTKKISLENAAAQLPTFRLTVVDDSGNPLPGVLVKCNSLADVPFNGGSTNSKGILLIQPPSSDTFLVTLSKTGYQAKTDYSIDPLDKMQTITLSPLVVSATKAKVIVKVSNSQQQSVQAQVTFTSSYGTILDSAKTSGGQAELNVEVGATGVVSATAYGADAGKYEQYYYPDTYDVASGGNVITVTMVAIDPNTAPVSISVKDVDSKNPLAAYVSFYSKDGNLLDSNTAINGNTNFSAGKISSPYYVTAYISGYLPGVATGLLPGNSTTISLTKIKLGMTGSIAVQVLDADGTPVPQASLSLHTTDQRYAGYPVVRTDADGQATFDNISLGVDYVVYADKSPKNGRSAVYRASAGDPTKVTLTLNPTTAKITVTTRDAVNDTGMFANVIAYGPGMGNTTCTTVYPNYACELTVRAESTVYIQASAANYETTTSPAMVLSTGDAKAYPAYLLPSAFKDQFFVRFTGLLDMNGKNVTLVDKGEQYDAQFIVNIPSGSSSSTVGFMVRAGSKESLAATDSKESFAILSDGTATDFGDGTDPVFAATYQPSTSCSNDRKANSELGYFKWVYFQSKGVSGAEGVSVRILSKPTASSTDKLQINYNGWYSPGGSASSTYLRSPEDSVFGSALRTASRDYCYAQSSQQVFSVANGRSTCTSSACISLDFSDGTASYGSSYLGDMNTTLIANIEVRLLKAVQSPRIFVGSDGGSMQILNYSIATDAEARMLESSAKAISNVTIQLLPFSNPASLSFYLLPQVPVPSGEFTVKFYDGQTELVSAKGYVTVEGTGKMRIVYVRPDRINVSDYSDIAVKVADANTAKAITDATLSINETSGSPFDGSVPEPVTENSNGIYTFTEVYPTSHGAFEVVAEQPDYATVRQNVNVTSQDFLTVTPGDLDVCGEDDARSITVSNGLPLNLSITASATCALMSSYVYSQTGSDGSAVSYDATSSVRYNSGSQSYTFTLPDSATGKFTVRPAGYGLDCAITFNAVARDGSIAVQSVRYHTCPVGAGNTFLSVSPSEVVYTSDSGNCDKPATITVSNNLSTQVSGTVSLTLTGAGLSVQANGSATALDSGYTATMSRGASTQFIITPTFANKTLPLMVSAVAGPRTATAAIEIKNCPGVIDTVGPTILSVYPSSGQTITTEPVEVLLTTDKPAVCMMDKLYTFSTDDSSVVHTLSLSSTCSMDAPLLVNGSNIHTATCCNLAENGGKCSSAVKIISFTFQPPAAKKCANGVACTDNENCTSGYCVNGVCAASPSPSPSPSPTGTIFCGPNGIVCPCQTPIKLGEDCTSAPGCCVSPNSCDTTTYKCVAGSASGTFTYGHPCDGFRLANICDPYLQCMFTDTYVNPADGNNGVCGCQKDLGCKSFTDTPYCVFPRKDSTGDGLCSDSATVYSGCSTCRPPQVCKNNACSGSNGQIGGTVNPSKPVTNFFTLNLNTGKFTDASGKEVTTIPVTVSSILPVSGILLKLEGDVSSTFVLTFAPSNVGVFDLAGNKIDTLPSPRTGQYLFITYPDVTVPTSIGSEYTTDKTSSRVTFTPASAQLTISSSSWKQRVLPIKTTVIDTNQLTFGAGVFDEQRKMFLPFAVNNGQPVLDDKNIPWYEKRYPTDESKPFSIYLFNNILLKNSAYPVNAVYASAGITTSLAIKSKSGSAINLGEAQNNLVSDFSAMGPVRIPNGPPACFSLQTFVPDSTPLALNIDGCDKTLLTVISPAYLSVQTTSTDGTVMTHDYMAAQLNRALADLSSLNTAVKDLKDSSGKAVNPLSLLKIGDSNGKVPDIFVTANEGSTLRVLRFKYDSAKSAYSAPSDITGSFEYPTGNIIGTTDPSLVMYTSPGQKMSAALFCDLASGCVSNSGTYENVDNYLAFKGKGSCSDAGCTGSGSSYCNPASNVLEENPRLCCSSGFSWSNGKCIPKATDTNPICALTPSGDVHYMESSGLRVTQSADKIAGTEITSSNLLNFVNDARLFLGGEVIESEKYASGTGRYAAYEVLNTDSTGSIKPKNGEKLTQCFYGHASDCTRVGKNAWVQDASLDVVLIPAYVVGAAAGTAAAATGVVEVATVVNAYSGSSVILTHGSAAILTYGGSLSAYSGGVAAFAVAAAVPCAFAFLGLSVVQTLANWHETPEYRDPASCVAANYNPLEVYSSSGILLTNIDYTKKGLDPYAILNPKDRCYFNIGSYNIAGHCETCNIDPWLNHYGDSTEAYGYSKQCPNKDGGYTLSSDNSGLTNDFGVDLSTPCEQGVTCRQSASTVSSTTSASSSATSSTTQAASGTSNSASSSQATSQTLSVCYYSSASGTYADCQSAVYGGSDCATGLVFPDYTTCVLVRTPAADAFKCNVANGQTAANGYCAIGTSGTCAYITKGSSHITSCSPLN